MKKIDTKALHTLSYGLYVIGSVKEEKMNGQIANTVFQISSEPITLAVSINKNNLTHEFIKTSKVFSVSVLSEKAPLTLIGHFGFKSGREIEKYQTVSFKQGVTGAPILLEQSVSYLEAEVIESIEVETHTIFIGRVINARVLSDEEVMTYAYYHKVKRGSVPPQAPTYLKKENTIKNKEDVNEMKKYRCSVCGYIYDPIIGDPDAGIGPGTDFSNLPDVWVCPICGVPKEKFEEVK